MKSLNPRKKVAILRILNEAAFPLASDAIAREALAQGLELHGRTVRLYLQEMERSGLVTPAGRGRRTQRMITPLGVEELRNALVFERVGLTAAKVDTMACQMTFDLTAETGTVVLNLTTVDESRFATAVEEMLPVFKAGLGMGSLVAVARSGERLGHFEIPAGRVGVATVCSVTLNGVLLRHGVPAVSRFGGVLELRQARPVRFTDVVYYDGTSLDPLEIFIKGGLTSTRQAARTGNGRIGASFREIPSAAVQKVRKVCRRLEQTGLGGVLMLGTPNQPLLDFPVHEGRTGMIVGGGLNPAAALHESGIATENSALCALGEFETLVPYRSLRQLSTAGSRR